MIEKHHDGCQCHPDNKGCNEKQLDKKGDPLNLIKEIQIEIWNAAIEAAANLELDYFKSYLTIGEQIRKLKK